MTTGIRGKRKVTRTSGGSFKPDADFLANFGDHVLRYLWAGEQCTGKSVLDIGCGHGYGASYMAGAGSMSVLGVDLDCEAIRYAASKYKTPNLGFAVRDMENDLGVQGEFDLVTCFEVIEHLGHPERLLRVIAMALKGDGLLLLSTPNLLYSKRIWNGLSSPHHITEFDATSLVNLLSEEGYSCRLYKEFDSRFGGVVELAKDIKSPSWLPKKFLGVIPGRAKSWYLGRKLGMSLQQLDSRGRYHDFVIEELSTLTDPSFPTIVASARHDV